MTDDDLHALREMARPRTVTSLEEQTRLRYRVLRGEAPRSTSRRRAWLAPVAAAVVALAVLAGVGVALNRGGGRSPGLNPAPSGSMVLGGTLDPQETWAELARVAAATKPVAAGPKDQLHVREDMLVPAGGPDHKLVPQVHDTWYEVQGLISVRRLSDGQPVEPGGKGESEEDLDRAAFAKEGPGVRHPTTAWLAGLSSTREVLQRQLGLVYPFDGPTDAAYWNTCAAFMAAVDPLLPADARVGLLRLFGHMLNLNFQRVTIGGTDLVAMSHPMQRSVGVLFLDLKTAHVVGRATLDRGGPVPSVPPDVTGPADGRPPASPTAGVLQPTGAGASPNAGLIDTRPLQGADRVQMRWLYTYEIVRG